MRSTPPATARPARPSRTRVGMRTLRRLLVGAAGLLAACGGGGGSASGNTLPGVVLVGFSQSSADNVSLNTVLEFRFSSPIDPASVGPESIQVREGPTFGRNAPGRFVVSADRVLFEPALPGLCDLSDAGFRPGIEYHVTFVGHPETFAIRSLAGDPLAATVVASFHTLPDTSPDLFRDHVPGSAPYLVASSPEDGANPLSPSPIVDAVRVRPGNAVVLDFSENLDPCSITEDSIHLAEYEVGDPTLGFVPAFDSTPQDPYVWGGGTVLATPARIRCAVTLEQTPLRTRVTLRPVFDRFPDNALLVATITNGVRDLVGAACLPATVAFVTENLPARTTAKTLEFTGSPGDFEPLVDESTADVATARSPGLAQGWLLFAGDGDNGTNLNAPSGPQGGLDPIGCVSPAFQANDARPDDFDPATDVILSSGASPNACINQTDGSMAVVFEFRSFRVRNGVTVRITGTNPVIFLVSGDVLVEGGGRILARGDGLGGSPQGAGASALNAAGTGSYAGGIGVAGGGSGGASRFNALLATWGDNGSPGRGSPDAGLPAGSGGTGPVRVGAGRGAASTATVAGPNLGAHNRNGIGGGGGGHALAGADGGALGTGGTPWLLDSADPDGRGGAAYGTTRLEQAEAGSGGGGGGSIRPTSWNTGGLSAGGGGGGAGGGFVDFTAGGGISIYGEIDAAGGRGGAGSNDTFVGGGGGGGGSGGGIRLLTPHEIRFAATTKLSAAGGVGGAAGMELNPPAAPQNPGGRGADGRIVLEDGDSIVSGLNSATVIPNAGSLGGFVRGTFDPARFKGGGLRPLAVSAILDVGPLAPTYLMPNQGYGAVPVPAPGVPRLDFIAGIPQRTSPGVGRTGIYLEARAFRADEKGHVSLPTATAWVSVGSFVDSGLESQPTWMPGVRPADAPVEPDSTTGTFADLSGRPFLQLRVSFYLAQGSGPEDPGPYLDRWDLWFQHDQ